MLKKKTKTIRKYILWVKIILMSFAHFLVQLETLRFDLSNNEKKERKYSFPLKLREIVRCELKMRD